VYFPNSLKEVHSYLDLLGKEGETEGWGKREFPGSMHKGLLVISAVQVDPVQRQY
jgi:hypothetical protein